ncbi:NAD(P)H-dependent glycerol-3-phosphate dehydrogenase [Methanobrevibacter sp.]|uniref:NAD(P)H-dependent glycerol-3-phosphate dehydrogenase n=1 Tax=Methanobrevibacter sp. TaxID=66852 RepID=UPI00386CB3A0
MTDIGVIGAGAMGTAISQSIAENADNLFLYARKEEICDEINSSHYNSQYYPNLKLKENIIGINDYDKLKDVDIVFLCIPSSTVRQVTGELNNIISKDCVIVTTAKGIEANSNKRMTEVIEEVTGRPAVALSGPNIASEMAKNLSTATTIACSNEDYLNSVKNVLKTKKFKVNANTDVIGTEFCGIVKNVLAISQGICEGLDINDNARFALFTKSYSEVKEIIEALGGKRDTVDDYCGFGDIITASTLSVSRNHTLGVLYGQGIVVDEQSSGILFEGRNTTVIMKGICEKYGLDSLTVDFVYEVIVDKENPRLAFNKFWDGL